MVNRAKRRQNDFQLYSLFNNKMSERAQSDTYHLINYLTVKLQTVLRTMQEQISTCTQHYEAQIQTLNRTIEDKDQQIQSLKQKLQSKNLNPTPIKILLKNGSKANDKKTEGLCLTDRQNQLLNSEESKQFNSHFTSESITKTRPSLEVAMNTHKQFMTKSEKKQTRKSSSKIKQQIISKAPLDRERFEQLAKFSSNLLNEVKGSLEKFIKPEKLKMNSPRFLQRQKLVDLSLNRNSLQREEMKGFQKKKSINVALRDSIGKENSSTMIMGHKKLQRKSNSKKNLLMKKKLSEQNEENQTKKCIDVTIPVKIINVNK